MLTNLKALLVVLAISLPIFALARRYMLAYVDAQTYARRRNIWFALAILGFASPSIWLYALVAMPLMYWGAKRDPNPLALYVLLAFVIPNASVQIPTIGIGQLMEINQSRMMSVSILLPLMVRAGPIPGFSGQKKLTALDWSVLGLGLLQLALVIPYDSPTTSLRRAMIFFLDTFIVVYAFARLEPTAKILREVVASFALVAGLLAALALFESVRFWLLYIGIGPVWGAIEPFTAYIMRSGLLRAQVSTGHSLQLGYLASLGVGFWIYLYGRVPGQMAKLLILLLLCSSVFVSGSRGAWLTAMMIFAFYVGLRPNAGRYLVKVVPLLAVALVIAFNSPLKEALIDKLPIVGTADQDTVEYRQQIAEVSWRLIKQNPVFGDPFALRNMQDLKQGQGIIDIMNGYANIAVFNGGVGFALFVSTFVIALWRCFAAMRQFRSTDTDLACLGAMLIACLAASLFYIGTAAIHAATYWLTGMMACYANIALGRVRQTAFAPMVQRFQ